MSDALYDEQIDDLRHDAEARGGFKCTNCEELITRDQAERGNIVFGDEWLTRFDVWCSTSCRTETLRNWGVL